MQIKENTKKFGSDLFDAFGPRQAAELPQAFQVDTELIERAAGKAKHFMRAQALIDN
jgi:hypothetical protein